MGKPGDLGRQAVFRESRARNTRQTVTLTREMSKKLGFQGIGLGRCGTSLVDAKGPLSCELCSASEGLLQGPIAQFTHRAERFDD